MTDTERYHKRRAASLCVRCGKIPVSGSIRCKECQESNTAASRVVRQRNSAEGLCYQCGSPKQRKIALCERCNEAKKMRRAEARARARMERINLDNSPTT